MNDIEKIAYKLNVLEMAVQGFIDIFSETATPNQLAALTKLANEANHAMDTMEQQDDR